MFYSLLLRKYLDCIDLKPWTKLLLFCNGSVKKKKKRIWMLSRRLDSLNASCFCSFIGFYRATFSDTALKPRTHLPSSMPNLSSPFPADSWHCTRVTCFLLLPWQAWCWLLCRHKSALIYILRLCHSASHLGPKCKPCLMCHAHECHFKRLHAHACVWALSLFCPCSMKCWLPVLCFHVHLFEHPPCNQLGGNKMLKRRAGVFTLTLTRVHLCWRRLSAHPNHQRAQYPSEQ